MSNYYFDYTMITREEKLGLLMSLKPKDAKEEQIIEKEVKRVLNLIRSIKSGG